MTENFKVTPRCGGHSGPGFSTVEGGIVIDLQQMKGIVETMMFNKMLSTNI
jgi:FAD/FMN-containing dehydrogenase